MSICATCWCKSGRIWGLNKFSRSTNHGPRSIRILTERWCRRCWKDESCYNSSTTQFYWSHRRNVSILILDLAVWFIFRLEQCKITDEAGDREVYLIHSFDNDEPCFDTRVNVIQTSFSPDVQFDFRSFRFTIDGTLGDSERIQFWNFISRTFRCEACTKK